MQYHGIVLLNPDTGVRNLPVLIMFYASARGKG
jgi:hypothetical protein